MSLLVKGYVYFSILCIVKKKDKYFLVFETPTSRYDKYQITARATQDICNSKVTKDTINCKLEDKGIEGC